MTRRWWLALAAVLPLLALGAGLLWFLRQAGQDPAEPERHTDGIAVLTGGADRVDTGIRLLRDGRADWLLVSGAHRQANLADLLHGQAAGPLAARITLGRAAATTHGNAAEIAAWAGAHHLRSIRVVTAGYHMPRALLELRRVLPAGTVLVPHPVQPASLRGSEAAGRSRTWTLLLGEYLKYLGAWLRLSQLLAPPQEAR